MRVLCNAGKTAAHAKSHPPLGKPQSFSEARTEPIQATTEPIQTRNEPVRTRTEHVQAVNEHVQATTKHYKQ